MEYGAQGVSLKV